MEGVGVGVGSELGGGGVFVAGLGEDGGDGGFGGGVSAAVFGEESLGECVGVVFVASSGDRYVERFGGGVGGDEGSADVDGGALDGVGGAGVAEFAVVGDVAGG